MASLAEYLKRYTDGGAAAGGASDGKERRKKKKGKKKGEAGARASQGLVLVDDDPAWHRDVGAGEDAEDAAAGADADAPQVIEDVEVRRQRRLEERARHRPYLSLGEDGSGWVSLDPASAAPRPEAGPRDRDRVARHDSLEIDDAGARGRERGGTQRRMRHDSPDDDARGGAEADRDRGGLGGRGQPPEAEEHDTSQPRRVRSTAREEDLSPPRRGGAGTQDLSPPRRRRAADEEEGAGGGDSSPPRRSWLSQGREDSGHRAEASRGQPRSGDLSPPRRLRGEHGRARDEDSSPPRRKRKDEDTSPPRRQRGSRHDSEDEEERGQDMSPPRRMGAGQRNISPPRRPRPPKAEQADLSPPRRASEGAPAAPQPRRSRWGDHGAPGASEGPPVAVSGAPGTGAGDRGGPRMSDGSAAGLVSGRSIAEEMQAKREREAAKFALMQAEMSGRGAQTVFRDKSGKKVSNLELIMAEDEERKKRQRKVLPPPEWGKGLAQKRQAEAQRAEQQALADRPFAAHEADASRDEMLRERLRFGDPMAHLAAKKRKGGDPGLKDLGEDAAMVESGFAIPQDVPPHSWLKRRIAPPMNRFGIQPGRHWDGVDRSNGFERDLAKTQNERQAYNEEAYKWSVADM